MRLSICPLEKQPQQIKPINIAGCTNIRGIKCFSITLSIIPEISDGKNEIARTRESILISDRGFNTGKNKYRYLSAANSV